MKKASRSALPLLVTAILLALLAVLATLQWRWIGELSAAERRRMLANLESAADRFAEDFDLELARVVMRFHPDLMHGEPPTGEWLAERWSAWQADSPYPLLVRALMRVDDGEEPQCFAPERAAFTACGEPAAREVAAALAHAALLRRPMGEAMPILLPEFPALAMPMVMSGEGVLPPFLVVVLDRAVLADDLLPDLTSRYFGSHPGEGYAVAVLEPGMPARPLYASDPDLAGVIAAAPDTTRALPGLRPFAEMPGWRGRGEPGEWARHGESRARLGPRFAPWRHGMRGDAARLMPRSDTPRGPWTLAVKSRRGSVDEAVAVFRRHNLAISLAVLGLIAGTAVVMTVSAQRAQRLARQRLEFVAGVTHELHTPLTAICSAGENLADGVVADAGQVKRYGVLIEREGRRLADMVAQVLELAGIESGRRVYRREPVAVAELVAGALSASRWLLEENGIEVERAVDAGLPALEIDREALVRALRNLVENAVKYGGGEKWLAVRARREAGGVQIEVVDRGPGVSREDLPHVFEPFYRGDAAATRAAGSGLGLSLVRQIVEAHGGRVTVGAGDEGRGARFTLHLPAAEVPA